MDEGDVYFKLLIIGRNSGGRGGDARKGCRNEGNCRCARSDIDGSFEQVSEEEQSFRNGPTVNSTTIDC